MSSKLFIALTSPFEKNSIPEIRTLSHGKNDGILLFEDGIYYAFHPGFCSALKEYGLNIYAHADSCRARGYSENIPGVEFVDFEKAVELIMEDYDSSITCISGASEIPEVKK